MAQLEGSVDYVKLSGRAGHIKMDGSADHTKIEGWVSDRVIAPIPTPPAGFKLVVEYQGKYVLDYEGKYVYAKDE